eukprot:TRINITY_DN16229_c0_g1_i2.p1 TRINITY_DN16229_c0_g1~~TRINITY_DN16229_c0_g1_i2.p1  ORF type:complete len:185 (+),score=32.13 TRINITY_DN16229_c0_g1_i2:754-1308(+)
MPSRPAKRFCASPLEKLTSKQYSTIVRQIEDRENNIRTQIMQGNFSVVESLLSNVREDINTFSEELALLKMETYLGAVEFQYLLSLEEKIYTTLIPQLSLYEIDHTQMKLQDSPSEVPLFLSLVQQGNAGPVYKDKPLGPFTLRLLTGAFSTPLRTDVVQPELIDTSQVLHQMNINSLDSRTLR